MQDGKHYVPKILAHLNNQGERLEAKCVAESEEECKNQYKNEVLSEIISHIQTIAITLLFIAMKVQHHCTLMTSFRYP